MRRNPDNAPEKQAAYKDKLQSMTEDELREGGVEPNV